MTIFNIAPIYKKSAIEKEIFKKNGVEISYEIGWRWSSVKFNVENGDISFIDVNNVAGFHPHDELNVIEVDSNDSCWEEWKFPSGMSAKSRTKIENIWEESGFCGLEDDGWHSMGSDLLLKGPLKITDEDGNVVAEGKEQKTISYDDYQYADTGLSEWILVNTNPVHLGLYKTHGTSIWPFIKFLYWDGSNWKSADGSVFHRDWIEKWCGLKKKPDMC